MCPINDGVEDTEHFLLLCRRYDEQRKGLLDTVRTLLQRLGL